MVPNINLLPKQASRSSDSTLLYLIIGIVFFVGLIILFWQYFSARGDLASLTEQEVSLQQEVANLQMENDAMTMNIQQGSLEESVTFVERVSYSVSPLIDETQALLPDYTYLRNYSFSQDAITIEVDFETLSSVAEYISRLENSEYFIDAQLSRVSNFELNDSTEEEQNEEAKFNEVPRYKSNVTLQINQTYLATGGVR